MRTPLIDGDLLYVLANNGIFDVYNLKTGDEIYRQPLPVIGSGYSASLVAADGKLYLSARTATCWSSAPVRPSPILQQIRWARH